MNMKKIAVLFIIGLVLSMGSVFAGGASESRGFVYGSTTVSDQLMTIEVEPSSEIRAMYSASGINGAMIDHPLNSLTTGTKDDIDEFTTDNKDDVTTLVHSELRAALMNSNAERAVMRIGRHSWFVSQ